MKILVPIDFSETSAKALEMAIFLANSKKDDLLVAFVVEPVYDFAAPAALSVAQTSQEAKLRAKKLIATYGNLSCQIHFRQEEGPIAPTLAKIAKKEEVDLVIMGTQGASGIKKSLVGSVTVSLLKEVDCPVLVVPSQALVPKKKKFTFALAYANHESILLNKLIAWVSEWQGSLSLLHVEAVAGPTFTEELMTLGLKQYLAHTYPKSSYPLKIFKSDHVLEGLLTYMNQEQDQIMVMAHAHQSIWKEIFQKSQSIQMAFHTHLPVLIMQ
jgi:nucleotide-binding universal stress UspA family protein